MLVHSNLDTAVDAGIEDKLGVLAGVLTAHYIFFTGLLRGLKDHQECLNYMIAMHVHGELHNFSVQS